MYFKIATICFLLIGFQLAAQEFKLDKVTKEELEQKSYSADPDAPAVILYKKGITSFNLRLAGWGVTTEVVVRTKIYTKKGYEKATIEIPFYDWNSIEEEVEILEAVTYNLVDGKIEKTNLNKKEGVFIEDVNSRRKVKKLIMPNVTEGSIVEYRYILKSLYIESLPDWYFQHDIPADRVEYDVWIPQYLIYNRILNQSGIKISETNNGRKNTVNIQGFYKIGYHETAKLYVATQVPAYKEESYVDNILNYLPYVKHELSGSKSVNGEKRKYVSDWESVAELLENYESFGLQTKKYDYFQKDIDSVLADTQMRNNAVTTVFNYVKNRMTWNESYGYDCVKGTEYAYEAKTGNVAEINLLLVAMLQYAGIDARPVILSTRNNGITTFHSLESYNYVVAGVQSMGNTILLDATDKQGVPGILPLRALNGVGRMIKRGYTVEEINLSPASPSIEDVTVMAELSKDGILSGKLKTRYFDYNAYLYRHAIQNITDDTYIANKESKLNNIEISDYSRENEEANENPVVETFSFISKNSCEAIGNKLYVSPMLFYTSSENPFKEEKRLYPIDFMFPRQDRYNISITIPKGYVIESLPQSVTLAMESNICVFRFNIEQRGNQIQMLISSDINVSKLNPEYYNDLKSFFNDMLKKQNEKIVLKKV